MRILITGGSGFIGSTLIAHLIEHTQYTICNVDKLTYAANPASLAYLQGHPRYSFEQIDICDASRISSLFESFRPTALMHLAAESHVDRSIQHPRSFIDTNITGTFTLLDVAHRYYSTLSVEQQQLFRFHHISTDEVYGDLANDPHQSFKETSSYRPSSPYSASKAAADHLVRAWQRTYGLPTIISHSSNNYGPRQHQEKLIPKTIFNALAGKKIPIYGDGAQIRDWLYVGDHAKALTTVLQHGEIGESYNIGGNNECPNIEVVLAICSLLEELAPDSKPDSVKQYKQLITHVSDRAGHDVRYALDTQKIKRELGWQPSESFQSGLKKTVLWYLNNIQDFATSLSTQHTEKNDEL